MIIADSDAVYAKHLHDGLLQHFCNASIDIVSDGNALQAALQRVKPDIVLMDLLLEDTDSLSVLNTLVQTKNGMGIIVHTALNNAAVLGQIEQMGIGHVIPKPSYLKQIIKRVETLMVQRDAMIWQQGRGAEEVGELEAETSKLLTKLGMSAHLDGYRYIKQAVLVVIEAPHLLDGMTTELYPLLANNNACNASQVERSMRYAIKNTFESADPMDVELLFGYSFAKGDTPTNGEFIAMVADRVLMRNILRKPKG
ncbi:response regulator [Eubacteriales bacterium OttesenSCG-928-N14]|nr:response regulator [Eubacteriales bacterium OttesenSCG-928-N14]